MKMNFDNFLTENEKCFICYRSNQLNTTEKVQTSTKSPVNKENVLKQRLVVFLLKKFFVIPEETFCQFQQKYGNASSWINWCDSCSVFVQEAKTLFDRVKLLEHRIKLIKKTMECKISSSGENYKCNETTNMKSKDEPTEIVRTLIIQDILSDMGHSSIIKVKTEKDDYLEDSMNNETDGNMDDPFVDFGEYNNDEDSEESSEVKATDEMKMKGYSFNKSDLRNTYQFTSNEENGIVKIPLPKYANFKVNFQMCPLCSKHFSSKQECYKHLLTHPPPCPYCNEQLLDGEQFKSHVKNHKDGVIKCRKCCVCYQDFKNFIGILNHKCHRVVYDIKQNVRHEDDSESSSEESPSSEESSEESSSTEILPSYCSVCNAQFPTTDELKLHRKTHHKNIPTCSVCQKTFKDGSRLKEHLITHSDPDGKPFKCPNCGKAFSFKKNLKKHQNLHRADNPYRCTICEKNLSTSASLREHLKIHSGENKNKARPFLCTICGKSYSGLNKLRFHEKFHRTEKPHACKYCDMAFVTKHRLVQHERTHTGEKVYSCSFCPLRFAQPVALKKHTRTHTGEPPPHQCSFCGMGFEVKSDCTVHQRTHTGEKPYPCEICGIQFANSGRLRKHTLSVHENEPPKYSCTICGKRFHGENGLKQHGRVHSSFFQK